MKRKKVAVSACLLGEFCRYDGTAKKDDAVLRFLQTCEVIPFCPEAPVLGTPRGRISVIETAHGRRVLRDSDKTDVTDLLQQQTQMLIDAHPDLDVIILKSKSPSCGIGTTPIRDAAGRETAMGSGIAARTLMEHFPSIPVIDEIGLRELG